MAAMLVVTQVLDRLKLACRQCAPGSRTTWVPRADDPLALADALHAAVEHAQKQHATAPDRAENGPITFDRRR